MTRVQGLAGLALTAAVAASAQAAVTNVALWRGGENDVSPGPTGSFVVADATTIDATGNGNNLTGFNSGVSPGPYYVPSPVAPINGSTSTYAFDANASNIFSQNAPVTTATSNWGIQCYTTATAGGSSIMSNGDANLGGFGLLIYNAHYSGIMNGITVLEGTVAPDGEWHNLALVNDNGTLKLFVDGSLDNSSTPGGSNAAAGHMTLGGAYSGNHGYNVNFANGSIDEARVFTFALGSFQASDLTTTYVPEPTMLSLVGLVVGGLMARRRR